MKHQKHGKATLLKSGNYSRYELALVGTNCDRIKEYSRLIATDISNLKVGYMDANHHQDEKSDQSNPFSLMYLDQQSYADVSIHNDRNKFDHYFNNKHLDLILINGNHFQAKKQIVFLDRKKENSLLRRLNQLEDVQFFIQLEEDGYFPSYLLDKFGKDMDIPIFNHKDKEGIFAFMHKFIQNLEPPLYGLVLAGGYSTRMGVDKGKIQKQGEDLRVHIYNQLEEQVEECYFSGRKDQLEELSDYPFIEDRLLNMGPFGAIISAFMHRPDAAWLVVACDQVKIDKQAFTQLINARDVSKIATAFYSDKTSFPDPLPAIWEPKSYARLLNFLSLGYSCPRKVLINSDINLIHPEKQDWLFNMNTPEDAKEAKVVL